jgi:mono/diheme cytochrome c family protein
MSVNRPFFLGLIFACALTGSAVSAPEVQPKRPAAANLAIDPGKAIVNRTCQSCHDLGTITEAHHTAKEWPGVVQRMRGNGADLNDDQAKQVQDYLIKTYATKN